MIFENIAFDIDAAIIVTVDNQLEIRNCEFNHIGSAQTAIFINSSVSTSVFIENCIFHEQGTGNFLFINNQSPNSTLYFLNCSFFNENRQPNTRFLSSISEDVTIDSCRFVQPAGDSFRSEAIQIYPSSNSIGSFSFINNDVFNAINRFIGTSFYQKPIFANNTFHDFNREMSEYFMVVILYTFDSFLFENNTYKNIAGGAPYNGGIATWVQSRFRERITIEFINCRFINITNQFSNQGGVFHHGSSSTISNSSLIFNSCIFKDNYMQGYGGVLAFAILGNSTIINCDFIANTPKPNSSLTGGAIYISPINTQSPRTVTIKNCNFINNEATEGSAIYCQDSITSGVEVSIESCTFRNNGKVGQSQIVCYSPSFTFFNNIVQYTSDSEIGSSNEYSIILPSAKMIDISHCCFFNQNEENAKGGGFIQVSQQSNSMVYDNCFNLNDLVFNSSKHYSSIQLFLPQLYSFLSNNVTICNYEYKTPFCTIQLSNETNVGGSIINLNNWSFYNCKTSINNTGVSLYALQSISFKSCFWYNNSVSNGGLINFRANCTCQEFQVGTIDSISFINCIFLDIHNHSGMGFALLIESHNFEFDQCTFTYSTDFDDTRCQAIAVVSDDNIVITNSIINGTRSYGLTGGIFLQPAGSNPLSSFLMANVTFRSIQSSVNDSSDVCFYLMLQSFQNVVIDDIHIDSSTGKSLCSILLNSLTISFNSWTVTSNILTSNDSNRINNWCNFLGSPSIEFNNCLF